MPGAMFQILPPPCATPIHKIPVTKRPYHSIVSDAAAFEITASSCSSLGVSRSMAVDAERGIQQFEELLRRVVGGEQRGLTLFPIVFGVARDVGDSAPELERVVMINPLTRGMVVFQGESRLLSELLAPGLAAAGAAGPPPASMASIEALREVDPGEDGAEEECPVCLDGLRTESGQTDPEEEEKWAGSAVVREMPCQHRFHSGCIKKWLGLHGTCPVCRYQMPVEEEEPKKVSLPSGSGERDGARELVVTISFGGREERVDEQQQQQLSFGGREERVDEQQQQQQQQQDEEQEQMEGGEVDGSTAMEAID